ncbi:MAG TPA: PLP-dependent aminotransferase family protein [Woeseiaceae bacterium]
MPTEATSNVVTFDEAPPPGFINFGVGQPSADLLPLELVREASERFFAGGHPLELNYGPKQGDPHFRSALAAMLEREHGAAAPADSLFVTAGSSQALDFVCGCFTQPGDVVFAEDPSYFLAFQIFRDHGLEVVGIPVDEEGMDVDALERALRHRRPKLVYVIPSFQNPTGRTTSGERRRRLVELSRAHDFLVVADEVYQMLWHRAPPPPALGTLVERGNVLSLGSFSKILAPGLRLGWIQANAALLERLLASGVVNSGGSFNQYTSHIVRQAIEAGLLEALVGRLREAYRGRVEAMDRALRQHAERHLEWQRPDGGYFFWLRLRGAGDTSELKRHVDAFRTGFQPGALFSASGDGLHDRLRLSFAHYGESDIAEGVARLAALLDRHAGGACRDSAHALQY